MLRKLLPLTAAAGVVVAVVSLAPMTASAKGTCRSHKVSYLAQGRYVSSSMPLAPSSSWSGTLTIKLQSANHQFRKANNLSVNKTSRGTDYTYTVSNAAVHFGKGVKSPATTADHVTVTGTVTEFSKACTSTTPTIAIRSISVSK